MKIPKVTDNKTYFKMSVLPFLVLENVTATCLHLRKHWKSFPQKNEAPSSK